jgi:hypothetical protein
MTIPVKAIPHTCTLRGCRQNFTLGYDTGTAAFAAANTLTGATSHATAIIVSVNGTTATGTLTLHTVSGTFQDNETITDNGTVPGSAKVSGTIADAFDANGELVYTNIDTTTTCKIYNKQTSIQSAGQALYFEAKTRIILPATVTPAQGDQVISTVTGFTGTWVLGSPNLLPGPGGIAHHWECDLVRGGA